MKKIILVLAFILCLCQLSFAELVESDHGSYKLYSWVDSNGNYAESKWVTIDMDSDGYYEYYYFDADGYMVMDGETDDGYEVNEKGQWVKKGVVQTKKVGVDTRMVGGNVTNDTKNAEVDTPNVDVSAIGNGAATDKNGAINTENINPDMIPPKVQKAMEDIRSETYIRGLGTIPVSRKYIIYYLDSKGYKKDVRNRAITESGIIWKNHAWLLNKYYKSMGFSKYSRKWLLKFCEFNDTEIDFALKSASLFNPYKSTVDADYKELPTYFDPSDYAGMTNDQITTIMKSKGATDGDISLVLNYLKYDIKDVITEVGVDTSNDDSSDD